jgi:hypothetical protein
MLGMASAWALIVAGSSTAAPAARAGESLEALMPDDVIGYARGVNLGGRLDDLLQSSLWKEIQDMEAVRFALSQKGGKKLERFLEEFREATGKEAVDAFRRLFGTEIVAGVRIQFAGPEVIVLSRAAEKDIADVLGAIQAGVEKRIGRPLEPEESMHLDRKIRTFEGKVSIAPLGDILVLSNSRSAVESVIDLAEKRTKASVKDSPAFRKGSAPGDAIVSVAARPRFIPGYKVPDRFPEPLQSLLFGGVAGALAQSELLTASLRLAEGAVVLDTAAHPGDARDGALDLKPFFPPPESDALLRRLAKRGVLSAFTIRRNLTQWWEAREDLLTPGAAGQLLEFAQGISNFFQGRSFQDEILPEIGPTITFLARNQSYSDLKEKPKPTIPGFALIFELKNAGRFGNSFVAAFQAIVSLINLGQAEKKKGQDMAMMLTRTEKFAGHDLHTVSIAQDREGKPGLVHNFTPSLAVAGTRVVLSSSAELAKVVLEELAEEGKAATGVAADGGKGSGPASDSILIDAEAARAVIADNFEIIVADNMMKKGQSREEAEREMKQVLEVAGRLRHLELETRREGESVHLTLRIGILGLKEGKPPAAGTAAPEKKGTRL